MCLYFFAFASTALAQTGRQEATSEAISQTFDALESHRLARKWDSSSIVVDGYTGLKKVPAFVELGDLMELDWPKVLEVGIGSNPDAFRLAFIIASARRLPPEQYRQFLGTMVEKTESGIVPKRELKWAIFVPNRELAQVWINTWESPETQSMVARVKKLYADDEDMQLHCNSLLSGDLAKQAVITAKRMDNPRPTHDVPGPGEPPKADEKQEPPSAPAWEMPAKRTRPVEETTLPWGLLGFGILLAIGGAIVWAARKDRRK